MADRNQKDIDEIMQSMIRGGATSEAQEFLNTVFDGLEDLPDGSSAGLEDFDRTDRSTAELEDVDRTDGSGDGSPTEHDGTLVVRNSGEVK